VIVSLRQKSEPPLRQEDACPASPSAFDAFYRAHFPFVWRTLRRLGVAEASLDDAAQEVFVVVHRRLGAFRADSSPKAWLYAIAQRVASDQRRTVRRKGNLLPLHEDMPAAERSPLESAMRSEASDLVLAFLAELDPDRRTAFILADLEQMSAPEVARAAKANVNTIYYRIASARKAFVAFVERHKASEPHHEG
jgi:RNA polymerase sigma-70 factor (ECF subfamily)